MKYFTIVLIATAATLAGCGKKEEPVVNVEEPAATAPEQQVEKDSMTDKANAMMDQAKSTAMAVASEVDWGNMSWNDVSKINYENKAQLIQWAAPQIDSLKDQLTKAAMKKGMASLAGLSDSGWQGAIKSTVEALESVRTSSPETWDLAISALTTSWQALQAEATKYMSEG